MVLKTISGGEGDGGSTVLEYLKLEMLQLPSHSFQVRKYGKKYKHTICLEWLGNGLYIESALSYLSYD